MLQLLFAKQVVPFTAPDAADSSTAAAPAGSASSSSDTAKLSFADRLERVGQIDVEEEEGMGRCSR